MDANGTAAMPADWDPDTVTPTPFLAAPSPEEQFLNRVRAHARYAFQPIVDIQTGAAFGYEALLRNHERVGAASIPALFDEAYALGVLHRTDMLLRAKAIADFARLPQAERCTLFFNLDGRIFESADYHPHQTLSALDAHGVSRQALCFELSEHYDNDSARHLNDTLAICREHDYKLAIDDFGRGFSEMKMLYDHHPDFVKVDRYFINGIEGDSKKRLLVSTIVNLAHVLGTLVVAEGVETEAEFLACKEVGCDLVQGFFVAPPTVALDTLRATYPVIADVNRRDRRRRESDSLLVRDFVAPLETLSAEADLIDMFEAFRRNKDQNVFPVLDSTNRPVGIVRELDLKEFIYLKYGRDLLQNKSYAKRLPDFMCRCPIADVRAEVEKILEMYAMTDVEDGIIITENTRYLGFLTADNLLRLVNEKNLIAARDENPLTKLPGNNSISDHISQALENDEESSTLVYFDFNDFKPFNDTYGFRQGDRVIMLFADLMRRQFDDVPRFLGHVGGDDFFAGFRGFDPEEIEARVATLIALFRGDVESFYSAEDREAGGIIARGRDGQTRTYALLSCCAAVLHLPAEAARPDANTIMRRFAHLKTRAKNGPDPMCAETVTAGPDLRDIA